MNREERLDDPEEVLRLAMDDRQASTWTALPGVVTAVDLTAQTLSVQPAIRGRVTAPDGAETQAPLPLLVDVPIVWPRAGGFALTFPIAVGDEVLVVFAARCIDAWWQSGEVAAPAEARMHDLSDGFAILAPTSQPRRLADVSAANAQLRNEAGDTYIEITPDGRVQVVATDVVTLFAPTVNIEAAAINLEGLTSIDIDAPTVTIGGIVFGTHIHGGSPGPSNP